MKRAVKFVLRTFSIIVLGGFVLFSGIINKLSTKNQEQKDPDHKNEGIFSAFEIPHAFADAPGGTGGDSVFDCSGDTSDGDTGS